MSKEIIVSFTNDEVNGLISHFMQEVQLKEDIYKKLDRMAKDIGDEYNQLLAESAKANWHTKSSLSIS